MRVGGLVVMDVCWVNIIRDQHTHEMGVIYFYCELGCVLFCGRKLRYHFGTAEGVILGTFYLPNDPREENGEISRRRKFFEITQLWSFRCKKWEESSQ